MDNWADYATAGVAVKWPYPIRYGEEEEISGDVLVLGGGIAGCWAAIAAARKGAKVILVERSATISSGAGGPGCDHWSLAITGNPACPLTAEEVSKAIVDSAGGYHNGIVTYITARESYETLLELEGMGAKIRDTENAFKGSPFRDENTRLLYAYDYENKFTVRVWGTTFKPALYKECKRLGVTILDRVMATSLLTEGGNEGSRVIGATGINVRTGGFMVFKAKATVLCTARPTRVWHSTTEETALFNSSPPSAGGATMAWRVGAEFTMMEKSMQAGTLIVGPCHGSGHPGNTWFAATMVDAKGKEIPWVDRDNNPLKTVEERYRPSPGQKFTLPHHYRTNEYDFVPPTTMTIDKQLENGEYTLPLFADLTAMPREERRVIFGLMVGQESKSRSTYKYYSEAGFDPDKDMLQGFQFLAPYAHGITGVGKRSPTYASALGSRSIRTFYGGGLVVDWDLKTSLDGLYAAGWSVFASGAHPEAACTGKYAGRHAAEFARRVPLADVSQNQVRSEKRRVYAPTRRKNGIDWKELNHGINKVMQVYCGEPKGEELMKLGLKLIDDLKWEAKTRSTATDPHKLSRMIETMEILTTAEMILHACRARKASSYHLGFKRWDYPAMDPEEWCKFITIKRVKGSVKVGELPFEYWGPFEKNYEAHCLL
ncbi:MAG: FAD-dependent oxidoreductase [Deltaproteobacteria bacterium]|nr:FAD-dependent oxidoreductase [Deltaproteobacteria bacterium]